MAQPNKPMTAQVLLEISRQSAETPTYLRELGGLPQQVQCGQWEFRQVRGARFVCDCRTI